MLTPTLQPEAAKLLSPAPIGDKMEIPIETEWTRAAFMELLRLREMVLATELNRVRELLGKNPKVCPHCGGVIK